MAGETQRTRLLTHADRRPNMKADDTKSDDLKQPPMEGGSEGMPGAVPAGTSRPPIGRGPASASNPSEVDLRIRQFAVVCGYLQYENAAYWTRCQFFVVANVALIGLLANALPVRTCVTWARIYTLFVPFMLGLVLNVLWLLILRAAHGWIGHWHDQLRHLEPKAFPDGAVTEPGLFCKATDLEIRWPIKRLVLITCWSFIVVRLLALIYLGALMVAKLTGMDLL
jgi:hypothetical protein